MKLKERFKQWLDTNPRLQIREVQLEVISDKYAIGFLEFTENTYSFGNVTGKWYLHSNTSQEYTTKQLLEIYKKAKGL